MERTNLFWLAVTDWTCWLNNTALLNCFSRYSCTRYIFFPQNNLESAFRRWIVLLQTIPRSFVVANRTQISARLENGEIIRNWEEHYITTSQNNFWLLMNQKNRNERKSGVLAEKSAGVDNTQTQFTYNFEEGGGTE